jgi:chorismate-pyruvate lyase
MNPTPRTAHPDLAALFAQFPPADDVPEYEIVSGDDVPEPYRGLLVHEHHMTVTVEAHHGDLVDERILARRHQGNSYARKILLALQKTGRIVQFGIVRIDLGLVGPAVREAIVAGKTPVGRVLIENDVLRRIEPTAFLRIAGKVPQMRWFGLTEPQTLYGRLALIHCDGRPAVELLEIVAP